MIAPPFRAKVGGGGGENLNCFLNYIGKGSACYKDRDKMGILKTQVRTTFITQPSPLCTISAICLAPTIEFRLIVFVSLSFFLLLFFV